MMTDKDHQKQEYPIAPAANGHVRSDQEAMDSHSKDARRKKYMKWCLYLVIFAVFQIGVITLFALTIAKFRTPKFRVESGSFPSFQVSPPSATNPSFNLTMVTEFSVKNTNFGHFRYQESVVDFYFRDVKVGEATVEKGRAKWRSTKKFDVRVSLSSANANLASVSSELGSDLSAGVIRLTSKSRLNGKVKIMVILSKKKKADMDCTMDIFVQPQQLRNIVCK